MKTISKYICAAVVAASSIVGYAQGINPITQAMLDSYDQILQQNPNDYLTLYERGVQYYRLSRYDLALNDIKKAIANTPAKDKTMLASEYELATDIYIQSEEYPEALEAVNAALAINPDSYRLLYQKGNVCLYLNNLEEAKSCFTRMQRLQSRSQEAFFGLARVAVLQGDKVKAEHYMNEAEKLDPTNYITYCRLGDLNMELKENDKAAANYLSAFGLAGSADRPIASLLALAAKDYSAVSNAIEYALGKTDNKVPLYFIKGNIALNNGKLEDAYMAFEKLLQLPDGQSAAIYTSQADVCYRLANYPEANEAISKAVLMQPTSRNLALKSKIERAQGKNDVALSDAKLAYDANNKDIDAAIELAYAYLANNQADNAISLLNDVIDSNADAAEAMMLRAYINSRVVSNPSAAVGDYMRVARLEPRNAEETAYKAMAQTLNGKKLDGDDTIAALESSDTPDTLYWAAVYYAQTGQLEKAVEVLAKAQQAGYENDHNIWYNKDANLNVDPIRYLMK